MYFSYYKRAFFIKALKYRRFGNDIVQSVSVVFHGAFRWLFLFTIKNHLCADDYAATACAHKIHTIKTRPNNPLRFLQRKNSIRRHLANDLTCAARKTTFRTRKRFHNKQYTPKSKDQPHGSDRTHFYVRFNNGYFAMHRQTYIFLLSHKITTVQQKTKHNKHEKPSRQSIVKSITKTTTTNNPHNLSISQSKTRPKQTQRTITKKCNVFEY